MFFFLSLPSFFFFFFFTRYIPLTTIYAISTLFGSELLDDYYRRMCRDQSTPMEWSRDSSPIIIVYLYSMHTYHKGSKFTRYTIRHILVIRQRNTYRSVTNSQTENSIVRSIEDPWTRHTRPERKGFPSPTEWCNMMNCHSLLHGRLRFTRVKVTISLRDAETVNIWSSLGGSP